MGFLIGIGLLLLGWFLRSQRNTVMTELLKIQSMDTSTVQQLQDLQGAIAQELGPGAFRDLVELKGTIQAKKPLTSELGEEDCVYYRTLIEEESETTTYETNEEGKKEAKTSRETRKVAGNETSIQFQLEDATGKITVNPNDASIDAVQVVDHYEPYSGQKRIKYKGFKLDHNPHESKNHRILGYRFQEWVLRTESPIYLLGEVTDREGQLLVHKPGEPEHPFLITYKTEAELVEDKKSAQTWLTVGWWACLGLGIVALLWGLVDLFL